MGLVTSPDPDLSTLPFRPAAVLTLEPAEEATIPDVIAPLLRAALALRYPGGVYPESDFHRHLTAILERQELGACAFDTIAFAYPDHDGLRVDRSGLDEPLVAVGICRRPVRWLLPKPGRLPSHVDASLDGRMVRVVFLILSGENIGQDIRIKAGIARWATSLRLGGSSG